MLDGVSVVGTPAGVLGLVSAALLGLVVFSVRSVLKGALIPRNVHDEAIARERAQELDRRALVDCNSQIDSVSLALGRRSFVARRRHSIDYDSSSRLAATADCGAILTTDLTVTVH